MAANTASTAVLSATQEIHFSSLCSALSCRCSANVRKEPPLPPSASSLRSTTSGSKRNRQPSQDQFYCLTHERRPRQTRLLCLQTTEIAAPGSICRARPPLPPRVHEKTFT